MSLGLIYVLFEAALVVSASSPSRLSLQFSLLILVPTLMDTWTH